MIVVDSNVVAYCWIASDRTALAQRVRVRDPEWHVPVLWRSELRSALAAYIWRGAIDANRAAAITDAAEAFLAGYEHQVASRRVLELAASSRLSAYDCEFVALAEALGVPLVTEDRAVLKAFPEVALNMERYLASFPSEPPTAHERPTRYRILGYTGRRIPIEELDGGVAMKKASKRARG